MEKKHFFEILGVVGVIASLLFVGFELRLSRSIARNEGFNSTAAVTSAVLSMQAENADIWQRGCLGEQLTPVERVIFAKVFAATVNQRFTLWARANIGLMGSSADDWARQIAFSRYQFEGFNTHWIEGQNIFNPDLDSTDPPASAWPMAVQEMYEEYQRSGMAKGVDVARCGN